MLGALVVIEGSWAIRLRSVAVLLCASWLILSIGIELAGTRISQHKKIQLFCFSFTICYCSAMFCMWWFLFSSLESKREDAYSNLRVSMYMPPSGDLLDSEVAVKNDGKTRITKKLIACYIRDLNLGNGSSVHGLGVAAAPNGEKTVIVPPPGVFNPRPYMDSISIEGGGDAQTDSCLRIIVSDPYKVVCADVDVWFFYELESEPNTAQLKITRFVAKDSDATVKWSQQPVAYRGPYCKP